MTDSEVKVSIVERMEQIAIPLDAIAYAIEQPAEVDVGTSSFADRP